MSGEMQDDSWMARRWILILAMAVRSADSSCHRCPGHGVGGACHAPGAPGARLR